MSYNANIDCPYDGTPCPQKQQKRQEFRQYMAYMALNKIDKIFSEPDTTKCPDNSNKCIRFQRYLNILEKITKNGKQH